MEAKGLEPALGKVHDFGDISVQCRVVQDLCGQRKKRLGQKEKTSSIGWESKKKRYVKHYRTLPKQSKNTSNENKRLYIPACVELFKRLTRDLGWLCEMQLMDPVCIRSTPSLMHHPLSHRFTSCKASEPYPQAFVCFTVNRYFLLQPIAIVWSWRMLRAGMHHLNSTWSPSALPHCTDWPGPAQSQSELKRNWNRL